jgi:hypothetical protein
MQEDMRAWRSTVQGSGELEVEHLKRKRESQRSQLQAFRQIPVVTQQKSMALEGG